MRACERVRAFLQLPISRKQIVLIYPVVNVCILSVRVEAIVFSQSMSEHWEEGEKGNGKILPQFKHTLKLSFPKVVFRNWFFSDAIRRNQM